MEGEIVTESDEMNNEVIIESFEEIFNGFGVEEDDEYGELAVETEPLCASCFCPVDADEEQDIAYCERCQTTVFIERRIIE